MGPSESAPKRHLDRFSRIFSVFFWLTNVTDRHADKHADHATPPVAIVRILCTVRVHATQPKQVSPLPLPDSRDAEAQRMLNIRYRRGNHTISFTRPS